jgi:hypothetical protein
MTRSRHATNSFLRKRAAAAKARWNPQTKAAAESLVCAALMAIISSCGSQFQQADISFASIAVNNFLVVGIHLN